MGSVKRMTTKIMSREKSTIWNLLSGVGCVYASASNENPVWVDKINSETKANAIKSKCTLIGLHTEQANERDSEIESKWCMCVCVFQCTTVDLLTCGKEQKSLGKKRPQ